MNRHLVIPRKTSSPDIRGYYREGATITCYQLILVPGSVLEKGDRLFDLTLESEPVAQKIMDDLYYGENL